MEPNESLEVLGFWDSVFVQWSSKMFFYAMRFGMIMDDLCFCSDVSFPEHVNRTSPSGGYDGLKIQEMHLDQTWCDLSQQPRMSVKHSLWMSRLACTWSPLERGYMCTSLYRLMSHFRRYFGA